MFEIDEFLDCGAILSSSPGKVYVASGKRVWRKDPDPSMPASFFFPDFFLKSSTPWFVQENFLEIEISTLLKLLTHKQESKDIPFSLDWAPNSKELFSSSFKELKSSFEHGVLKKGVPFIAYESQSRISPEKLAYLLKNAIQYTMKSPVYIYGFWDKSEGMIGATPEILFHHSLKHQNSFVKTVACAGTCPQGRADDMLRDPKLLHEHLLVVDGIVESLSSFGNIAIDKPKMLHLPKLSHLVSEIELSSTTCLDFEQIVYALHPTPALGAFPKKTGMEWLKNLQIKIDRRRYGAPVGVRLKDTSSHAVVAIRNVQWQDDKLQIFSGCGVVRESDEENEWNEIGLKFSAIKSILGL